VLCLHRSQTFRNQFVNVLALIDEMWESCAQRYVGRETLGCRTLLLTCPLFEVHLISQTRPVISGVGQCEKTIRTVVSPPSGYQKCSKVRLAKSSSCSLSRSNRHMFFGQQSASYIACSAAQTARIGRRLRRWPAAHYDLSCIIRGTLRRQWGRPASSSMVASRETVTPS